MLVTALLVLLAAATFLAFVWASQRQLLYFPGVRTAPAAAAALPGARDVAFETADGVRLGGYFVPAAPPTSGTTVLVCNGNAGDRSDRAGLARSFASSGHNVLLFDYRGYGGNAGIPTEWGLAADARAALAYLESRGDVDRQRIVYFGESLGAAVAAGLAVERPPFALVLRSPFTSLAEVGRIHYPYLPVSDALLFDRYRTIDAVGVVRVPILVVAGQSDRVVPAALSRRVYEAAMGPRRLVILEGADHNDPKLTDGPALVTNVTQFLDEILRGRLRSLSWPAP